MRSETKLNVICGYSAIELQWLLSSFSELLAVRRALYIKYRLSVRMLTNNRLLTSANRNLELSLYPGSGACPACCCEAAGDGRLNRHRRPPRPRGRRVQRDLGRGQILGTDRYHDTQPVGKYLQFI